MKRALSRYSLLVVLAASYPGLARAADTVCTLDAMQANPASVIEPCSATIDSATVPDAERAQAFYVRGRAFARTRRTELAAQDLDVAVKLAPDRADIYVSRSNVETKLGRWREAWSDLNRALTINPRDARAWFAVAAAYSNAGDADEALKSLNRALGLDPTEPYSLLMRSQVLASRHQFNEALADATAMVNIPPATINKLGYVDARGATSNFHVIALNNRGNLYDQLGNDEAAEKDFDAAIVEAPSPSTYRTRAKRFLERRENQRALADLDEAVRLDPADGDTHYLRGLALASLGRYAQGVEAFDAAIAVHAKNPAGSREVGLDHLMRARMLRELGKTDEAVANVNEALRFDPDLRTATTLAMIQRGYWKQFADAGDVASFQAALRACMIDTACN